MKNLLPILLIAYICGYSQNADSMKLNTGLSVFQNRILIIHTFDARSANYRKNKKQLFAELTDSLKSILAEQIKINNLGEPIIVTDLIPPIFDSKAALDSLYKLHNATRAIVIKDLDAFFEQTRVEVDRNDDGSKSREASYDICSDVDYTLYKKNDKPYHAITKLCDPFSTRNVMSGLLSGGPDIVGKSKHAFRAIEKNGELFISNIENRLK